MSTAGILRPSEVVFYHPLDNFTEHTQSQAWGGSSGFTAGKVGDAASAATGNTLAVGPIANLGTGTTGVAGMLQYEYVAVAPLDLSRVLLARSDYASNNIYAYVGTVSGSDLTLGPQHAILGTSWGRSVHMAKAASGKVLLGSNASRSLRVLTVSGNDITAGAAVSISPDRPIDLCHVDGEKFLLAYEDGSHYLHLRMCEISGTDVTVGSATQLTSEDARSASLACLASGVAVVGYLTSAGVGHVRAVAMSGMSVTVGSSAEPTTTHATLPLVARLDSSRAILADKDHARVVTVSGLDLTLGTETDLSDENADGKYARALATHSDERATLLRQTYDDRFYARVLTVSGGTVSEGGLTAASTLVEGTEDGHGAVAALDADTSILALGQHDGATKQNVARVGELGKATDMTAPTPGAYPSTIGATRVVTAMWAKNLTAGSSTVTVERGYKIDMTATTVSLGGTTAVWSDAGISSLMSALNDGSDHLLVLDFENTSGTDWNLRTSVDGAAFVDQGTQDSGTQAVTTADTPPVLEIQDAAASQWIDELALWAGDKSVFGPFASDELANLYDLADTFGETMDKYEENYGAPICWQATAVMPDGTVWRDSGCGPCPAVIRVPRGASDIVVTDEGRVVSPRIQEG